MKTTITSENTIPFGGKLFKIQTESTVTTQRVSDLLCCAFEGGSNYWYVINRFIKPEKFDFRTDIDEIFRHLDYPLNVGGALIIGDKEDDEAEEKVLNLISIQKGLETMARLHQSHMRDFLDDNEDAITGDVFLQCCLFGEVIYG